MLKEAFELVERDIRNKKIRALLTTLGVIIGVCLIIILVSLGQAMENSIEYQFSKLGIKSIRVVPGGLNGPLNSVLGLDKSLVSKVESVRGVDYVNSVLMITDSVVYGKESAVTNFIGYDADLSDKGFVDTDLKLSQGRFFNKGERASVIIGSKIAKDLFEKEILYQSTLAIRDSKFKVIGILEETGIDADSRIYMPIKTAREIFNKPNIVNAMVVQVKEGFDIEKTGEDIKNKLLKEMNKDEFTVFTPKQLISQIQSVFGAVTAVLIAIASISIIVGAIGIMNAMFTSVLEKTQQIGTMKAIGARNSSILLIFLVEAGIIGIVGGLIGAIIGIIIVYFIGFVINQFGFTLLRMSVQPIVVLGALGFSFVIGVLSGIIPAYRAAKLNPVDALRYE